MNASRESSWLPVMRFTFVRWTKERKGINRPYPSTLILVKPQNTTIRIIDDRISSLSSRLTLLPHLLLSHPIKSFPIPTIYHPTPPFYAIQMLRRQLLGRFHTRSRYSARMHRRVNVHQKHLHGWMDWPGDLFEMFWVDPPDSVDMGAENILICCASIFMSW